MLAPLLAKSMGRVEGGRFLLYSKTCHMGSCLGEPSAITYAENLALDLNELLKSDQLKANLQEAVITSWSLQNLKGNHFRFQGCY